MSEHFFCVGNELIRYNAQSYRLYRFNGDNWSEITDADTHNKIRLKSTELPRHRALELVQTAATRPDGVCPAPSERN